MEKGKEKRSHKRIDSYPTTLLCFPQRLMNKDEEGKYQKFISMWRVIHKHPHVEALEQMLDYAKFMKELLVKKRTLSFEPTNNVHHCSAIILCSLDENKKDPKAFTIPFSIRFFTFSKALCD